MKEYIAYAFGENYTNYFSLQKRRLTFMFDTKKGLIRFLEISVKSLRKKLLVIFTAIFVILSYIILEKIKDSGTFRINRSNLSKQQ